MSINSVSGDPLSLLLRRMDFSATVYVRADYCGLWAVDTSGDKQVPFHLVTQGEGWLHSRGREPQQLLPGHLVFFPNDAAHFLASSADVPDSAIVNQGPSATIEGAVTRLVCGSFRFDRRAAEPLLNSLPATMVLNLSNTPTAGCRELVQLWMREAANPISGSDLALDRYAELVFLEVLRTYMAAGQVAGVVGALSDERLGGVLAAIHQDPGAAHHLKSMAAQAGMSPSAFTARFSLKVGMTPGAYVKHWRMQLAARALQNSERSLADIAAQAGYQSEVAFRKAFSSHFDVAPGRYRRQHNVPT